LFILGTVDTFTLVDGEGDNSLVVLDGSESSLLNAGDWGVSRNNYSSEDITEEKIPTPKMFPSIATPILKGVTSNNKRPSVFALPAWLVKTAAWTAAP
jgi:hypothetical protein